MTSNGKTDMLTAREIQERLQIDRSTIYRMAEAGQLPAIKVGKQWRFPADQFQHWYERQVSTTAVFVAKTPYLCPTLLPANWAIYSPGNGCGWFKKCLPNCWA